jgi:hypothetical protein
MTTFLAIVVAILTSILVYIEVKTHRFITQSYKGACLALNHADKGPNPAESKAYLIGIADAYLNMARFWGFNPCQEKACLVTETPKLTLLTTEERPGA